MKSLILKQIDIYRNEEPIQQKFLRDDGKDKGNYQTIINCQDSLSFKIKDNDLIKESIRDCSLKLKRFLIKLFN